ncbi:Integrin beta-5 [Ameca splendens]|uniref:Integrin beta-5 n=1 Tax=Ameca splendens TaxID=208324 RepID=A0ABV1AFI2_9TELE
MPCLSCQPIYCFVPASSEKKEEDGAVLCLYKTDNDCVMKFTYSEHASGRSILTALKEPECSSGPNAFTVLLAVVGTILLVGVVLLATWKLVITIHDRREFARFQSARIRARYHMVRKTPLLNTLCLFY